MVISNPSCWLLFAHLERSFLKCLQLRENSPGTLGVPEGGAKNCDHSGRVSGGLVVAADGSGATRQIIDASSSGSSERGDEE